MIDVEQQSPVMLTVTSVPSVKKIFAGSLISNRSSFLPRSGLIVEERWWVMLVDEEVFVGFRGDDFGPAFEVSLFEEVLRVLAGVFDLVEIGLSDGEWFVHGDLVFEGELSAGWE